MYTVKANQYSKDILSENNFFENGEFHEEYGKIHSIFKKSLNIKISSKLINIIGNVNMKLPFSIEVNDSIIEYLTYNLSVGDNVSINYKNKKVIFNNIGLELSILDGEYEYTIKNKNFNSNTVKKNLKIIGDFIGNSNIQNGFSKSNKEFLERLSYNENTQIDEFYNNIIRLKNVVVFNKEKEDLFSYFIGRGKGLTPSGDDLILGLISFLKISGEDNMSKELYKYLQNKGRKRTTDISLEYLMYGCKGKVGHMINDLCEAMLDNDLDIIEEKLINVSKKGHTSGIDTILGIFLGMVAIIEKNKLNKIGVN